MEAPSVDERSRYEKSVKSTSSLIDRGESSSGGVSSTGAPVNIVSKYLRSVSLDTWGLNGGGI